MTTDDILRAAVECQLVTTGNRDGVYAAALVRFALLIRNATLAEQPATHGEPVAIKWTLNGDEDCGYSNWLGETPFGRILITWKNWKEAWNQGTTVDEFPGGFDAYGTPDEVKAACEAEFAKRLRPTPDHIKAMRQALEWIKFYLGEPNNISPFVGARQCADDLHAALQNALKGTP